MKTFRCSPFKPHLLRVLLVLALSCAMSTHARAFSRLQMPMGYYVRQATTIVVADTAPGGDKGYDIVIKPREIIKGGAKLTTTITISLGQRRMFPDLPRDAKGVAVLLKEQAGEWEVLETYRKPEEIEALRVLVKIYELPSERAQLIALRDASDSKNDVLRAQLLADLRDMKNSANFPLLLDLLPQAGEKEQLQIIATLRDIGDVRAVPVLLQALKSAREKPAYAAAYALAAVFPGAPGVTEAFREVLAMPHLKDAARRYLAAYDTAIRADFAREMEARMTLYNRVSNSLEKGDEAGALFFKAVEDPKSAEASVRFSTDWVARQIEKHPRESERIWNALGPILTEYANSDDYLKSISAARILRALHHPGATKALLQLLDKAPKTIYDGSTRIAAWALADRGTEEKQQAMAKMAARDDWKVLRPLFQIEKDEGATLVQMLDDALASENVSSATEWIIFRLGDLREQRAIPGLFRHLTQRLWGGTRAPIEALINIGGARVEAQAEKLMTHPEYEVRSIATEILSTLQGKRALPILRRALVEKDFGSRSRAALSLGRFGTLDDLQVLIPLADYWTGDRANHYWMQLAVMEIRSRLNLDLKGPVMDWRSDSTIVLTNG